MEQSITAEYDGAYEVKHLEDIIDYLHNIAEVSLNSEDFAQKVGYGMTDETNGLGVADIATLEHWYHEQYLGL